MGLFDKFLEKKECGICGKELGLLGKTKLQDGYVCKDCARGLSPFFTRARESTVAQIEQQLAWREKNRERVAASMRRCRRVRSRPATCTPIGAAQVGHDTPNREGNGSDARSDGSIEQPSQRARENGDFACRSSCFHGSRTKRRGDKHSGQ